MIAVKWTARGTNPSSGAVSFTIQNWGSYIAGPGTPFTIVGSFEDDISGSFLISCKEK